MNELLKDDLNPYYKVQEIDYSKPANGYHYQTSFFQGIKNDLKHGPWPGSRDGHHISRYERPGNDLYLVGIKIDKKNKKAYLKNYIPIIGETGTAEQQAAFIKAAKVNTVHFSLVAYTKDKIIRNEEGEIERIEVVEYVKGGRNDAVEYGLGAMKQKTNMNEVGIKYNPYPNEHAARLRQPNTFAENATWQDGSKGKFRRTTVKSFQGKSAPKSIDVIWGKLKGKAGKGDPPIPQAIRFKISNWTSTQAKKWLDDNDIKYISFEKATEENKSKNKEAFIMPDNEYQEMLKNITNLLDNGKLSKLDLAKDLKIEIVTDKHRNAVKSIGELEKLLGPDVEKEVKEMINNRENVKKENFAILRERLMTEAFGQASTEEKTNLKRDAAEPHVSNKICEEKELQEQIEKAKNNSVVKAIAGQMADETSGLNNITGVIPGSEIVEENTESDYIDI